MYKICLLLIVIIPKQHVNAIYRWKGIKDNYSIEYSGKMIKNTGIVVIEINPGQLRRRIERQTATKNYSKNVGILKYEFSLLHNVYRT